MLKNNQSFISSNIFIFFGQMELCDCELNERIVFLFVLSRNHIHFKNFLLNFTKRKFLRIFAISKFLLISMENIKVTLPDGSIKEFPKGTTALQIAESISHSLAKKVLSALVDNEVWDATRPINKDCKLKLLTWEDEEGKATLWHSSAHLMAEAIESLYPNVKFWVGPPVENGFYYDIDTGDAKITFNDLEVIEKKMMELAKQNNPYIRKEVPKQEAIQYFKEKNDPYKLDLLERLNDGEITFYTQGNFTDLCRGPHVPHTGYIKGVKLLTVAGAYWKGDEKNKMLTRIYGISFPKESDLKEFITQLEEAKKRDHRKIGKELQLFTFSENVGMGLPLWLPKGTTIRYELEQYLRKIQNQNGYQPVVTPHIAQKQLYIISGHYEKYGKDSFQPIRTPHEGEEFFLKPMNCPHHCEIYKSIPRSYKDLPLRLAEFGTVYRYEQHGELHGLTRVRGFTQDDAHIFCTHDQVKDEFKKVIDIVLKVLNTFGFTDYLAQVSLRDPDNKQKYIGSEEVWEKAEQAIIEAAQEKGLKTKIEYGEAAFYGPKLDFMIKDAIGRKWQLGTIQVDYNLPERFELEYTGQDNQKHRPVMIHRAPFGSLERFIALLLEHTGGDLPVWISPQQVAVLPISEKFNLYAEKVVHLLSEKNIRVLFDDRNEKIGKKIREAEMMKIPFMLVIGEKEVQNNAVSVRQHKKGDVGSMSVDEFIQHILQIVTNYQ